MRTSVAHLVALVVLGVPATEALGQSTDAKQLVVVRGNRKTIASVNLVPGDSVAVLSVRNPPPRLIEVLRSQTGPAIARVERVEQVDNTLRIALYLASEAFKVKVKRLKRQRGSFSLTFVPYEYAPSLKPHTLIGRVPETPPKRPWRFAFPNEPRRHPCLKDKRAQSLLDMLDDKAPPTTAALLTYAKRMKNGACAHFFTARVAARALADGQLTDDVKTWAYLFSRRDRWQGFKYAYSYTAMIATAVLLRSGFLPEAETMLSTDRIQQSPRLMPYRALLYSDLLYQKPERKTSRQLLRALFKQSNAPGMKNAVATRLIDLATMAGPDAAKRLLDSLLPRFGDVQSLDFDVALRAGETRPRRRPRHARRPPLQAGGTE